MSSNAWGPPPQEPPYDFARSTDEPGPDFSGFRPYPDFDDPFRAQPQPQPQPEAPSVPKDPILEWMKRALKIALLGGVLLFVTLMIVAILLGFAAGVLGAL